MKALTLTQPWATLVAIGAKKVETRSWRTSYRGRLAIHAAQGFPKWAKWVCAQDPFRSALGEWGTIAPLPRGGVIATCNLVDCLETTAVSVDDRERAFGDYGFGRWAWFLEDVQPLAEPVPARGALGLWEWAG